MPNSTNIFNLTSNSSNKSSSNTDSENDPKMIEF